MFGTPLTTVPILFFAIVFYAGCTRPPEEDSSRLLYSIWGSAAEEVVEREIVQAFMEKHPEIEVDILTIGSRYQEKIQAMMVGQVAPDVIAVPMYRYDEWATRGVLMNLEEEFSALHEAQEVLPIPYQAFVRREGVFALPISAHGPATYFNRDALEQGGVTIPEEGLTWDYILEVAPKLSRRAGNPDALTDYALLIPPYKVFFWHHGASFFDDLYEPSEVTVNTPEAAEAIELLRELLHSGFAVPPEVASDEGTYQLFRDGRVAFFFDGRYRTVDFDSRTGFDWDVTSFPSGPVAGGGRHGGQGLAVWENSPRKEAALKFIRFYTSPEGARIAMQSQRHVPVTEKLAFGDEFLSMRPPESIHYFSEAMKEGSGHFVLYSAGAQEVRRIINQRVELALSRPDIPPEEILRGLAGDLQRWLDER